MWVGGWTSERRGREEERRNENPKSDAALLFLWEGLSGHGNIDMTQLKTSGSCLSFLFPDRNISPSLSTPKHSSSDYSSASHLLHVHTLPILSSVMSSLPQVSCADQRNEATLQRSADPVDLLRFHSITASSYVSSHRNLIMLMKT